MNKEKERLIAMDVRNSSSDFAEQLAKTLGKIAENGSVTSEAILVLEASKAISSYISAQNRLMQLSTIFLHPSNYLND